MQSEELSILQFLEVLRSLLSLSEDNDFLVTILLNISLNVLEHLIFTLDQNSLVYDALRHLISIITNQINENRVL